MKPEAKGDPLKTGTSRNRILVVDDIPENLRLLSTILGDEGYDLRPVTEASLALEMAIRNPPDLVLLDVKMPGMDGFELCRKLKADPRLSSIPVLFISSEGRTVEKVKAFSVGGVDYITKPFQVEELRSRIATHLQLSSLRRELEEHNAHLESRVAAQVKEIADAQLATILALVRLAERRDDDTGRHVERVQSLSRLLAEVLRDRPLYGTEIDDRFVSTIFQASALHDVGKVAIPDAILLKPGPLAENEFAIMMTHAEIGAETLESVLGQHPGNYFLGMGIDIARGHHENWDGCGYPRGLRGPDIPLSARIVTVVDFFDALSSDRIYRPAIEYYRVRTMLQEGAGSHFDPDIIDAFLAKENLFRECHGSGGAR